MRLELCSFDSQGKGLLSENDMENYILAQVSLWLASTSSFFPPPHRFALFPM